jgi:peroxiredoxin
VSIYFTISTARMCADFLPDLIIGVPGAFTPPCSSHVPGYVTDADKFVEKGIKGIYIVAVNDTFTTQAWKEKLKSDSPLVHFLADDTGDVSLSPLQCSMFRTLIHHPPQFTAAAGMSFDATGLLGNTRSQRYVAVVEDAVVKQFFIEDEAPNVEKTKADNVLAALK